MKMKKKIVFNFVYCCRAYIFTYRYVQDTKNIQWRIQEFPEGVPAYYLTISPPPKKKNLHENEEILGQRGGDAFFVLPGSVNDI